MRQIPLGIMIKDYFSRIWSVIKRFFEINNQKEEKISEDKESALPKDEDKNNYLN